MAGPPECILLERCLEKIKEKCSGNGCVGSDHLPLPVRIRRTTSDPIWI